MVQVTYQGVKISDYVYIYLCRIAHKMLYGIILNVYI